MAQGRVRVLTAPLTEADCISTAVSRLAAERGLTAHARHRAATSPTPSGAIELRADSGG